MLRILHMLGSLNIGGSQMMLLNLYRNIDREKIQFDIIVDHQDERQLAQEFEQLGSRIFILPSFNGGNIRQIQKAWDCFLSEHPEYKILHSHVRSYASLYIPIAKKHGLKTIIHSHNTSNGKGIPSIVKKVMQYPLRFQADYLMACSKAAGEWLYGKRACQKDKYIFWPNAIEIDKYRFSEETAAAYRKEWGLQEKFVIGHVGRLHEQKNHLFLLDVFAGICAKRPDAMLLLIGDGDLRETIEKKIRLLQLEDRVILAGNRNDVPQLLQAMDVFAFPSAWEGLGIVAIEAQASGVPCICSDRVPGCVKITDKCVFLPLHTEVWVNAILECCLERYDAREKIVESGYDIYTAARKLQDFYCSLQQGNGLRGIGNDKNINCNL